jgi:hypothetical protein
MSAAANVTSSYAVFKAVARTVESFRRETAARVERSMARGRA